MLPPIMRARLWHNPWTSFGFWKLSRRFDDKKSSTRAKATTCTVAAIDDILTVDMTDIRKVKAPCTRADPTRKQGSSPAYVTSVRLDKALTSSHIVRRQIRRGQSGRRRKTAYASVSLGLLISFPSLSDGIWTNHYAKTFWKPWIRSIPQRLRQLCFCPSCSTSTL